MPERACRAAGGEQTRERILDFDNVSLPSPLERRLPARR